MNLLKKNRIFDFQDTLTSSFISYKSDSVAKVAPRYVAFYVGLANIA